MANERTSNNQDDKKMGSNSPDQTMQHEQAKGSVSGGDRSQEKGEFDKNRQEKSAIGGGQTQSGQTGQGKEDRSQTGEPGRARSELDEKSSDKSRTEPTGQR